jgi:hypothetical protein
MGSDVVGVVGVVVVFSRGSVCSDGRGGAACGGEAWGNEGSEVACTGSIAELEEHGSVGGVVNGAAVRCVERHVAFVAGAGGRAKAGEADDEGSTPFAAVAGEPVGGVEDGAFGVGAANLRGGSSRVASVWS